MLNLARKLNRGPSRAPLPASTPRLAEQERKERTQKRQVERKANVAVRKEKLRVLARQCLWYAPYRKEEFGVSDVDSLGPVAEATENARQMAKLRIAESLGDYRYTASAWAIRTTVSWMLMRFAQLAGCPRVTMAGAPQMWMRIPAIPLQVKVAEGLG